MDSVKMIWPDQLILDSFCKLENLTVSNFTNLTNILPPNMLRTLHNLKRLNIDGCGSIEEVFEIQQTNNVEETHNIVATELRSLKLVNLGKLKHVWSIDPQGIITFGKLNAVNIHRCSSLKSIFPTSVAKALIQLEQLQISDCAMVEEIIAKEEGIETTNLFVFRNLKELNIYDCNSLEEVFEIQGTNNVEESRDVAAAELISLKLGNLEKVKHVWSMDPQGIITFGKIGRASCRERV